MVISELHSALFHIWAGDVELVARQALGILENADHFHVVLEAVAKDIGQDGRIVFSHEGQLLPDEGADTYVLEADSIEHSGGCLAEPGRGSSFHRFSGEAFDDDAAA